MKKKAFVLVGHSNWGKSYTLRVLTGGKHQIKYTEISKIRIFVRKMSNDDEASKSYDFVSKLDKNSHEYLIATLCPNFDDELKRTKEILKVLKRFYTLYFFVLRKSYKPGRMITEREIEELKKHGDVEIYDKSEKEAEVRAKAFETFIKKNIK